MINSLFTKSSSVESFASGISCSHEDAKSIESSLFDALERGDEEQVKFILNNQNTKTAVLQILLTTSLPNLDKKYRYESEDAIQLIGAEYDFIILTFLTFKSFQRECYAYCMYFRR